MNITRIAVHGFDTPASMNVTHDHLYQWHVIENKWSDIGYHWWIDRKGMLHQGRPDTMPGAGIAGYNKDTLHIGMAGGRPDFNYTGKQLATLRKVIDDYARRYPGADVGGHRDWGSHGKTCPGFNVKEWYYNV
jgi:N-acetylmuramoyl-L-alanine amidase